MTLDEMRQAGLGGDVTLHAVAHRAEQLQMAVRSNEMETIIDPAPTVRSLAAGS